jgi:hypothetical protein
MTKQIQVANLFSGGERAMIKLNGLERRRVQSSGREAESCVIGAARCFVGFFSLFCFWLTLTKCFRIRLPRLPKETAISTLGSGSPAAYFLWRNLLSDKNERGGGT